MLNIFIILIFIILSLYIIRLKFIKKSLLKQEQEIINLFNTRINMVPAIFEVTKNTFIKHDEVFKNILKYRKQELYRYYIKEEINNYENEFIKLIHLEELIHHELNFIFKISNKHQKLIKKGNFIYLRNLIIDKSLLIGTIIQDYKTKLNLYNKLVFFSIFQKETI